MSKGVTEYSSKFPAPKHSGVGWWLLALGILLCAVAFGAGMARYAQVPATPPPPVVVTRVDEQTRIVERVVTQPAPTPRTIEIRVDQTVVVTRIVPQTVVVNTFYTPTPPTEGKG